MWPADGDRAPGAWSRRGGAAGETQGRRGRLPLCSWWARPGLPGALLPDVARARFRSPQPSPAEGCRDGCAPPEAWGCSGLPPASPPAVLLERLGLGPRGGNAVQAPSLLGLGRSQRCPCPPAQAQSELTLAGAGLPPNEQEGLSGMGPLHLPPCVTGSNLPSRSCVGARGPEWGAVRQLRHVPGPEPGLQGAFSAALPRATVITISLPNRTGSVPSPRGPGSPWGPSARLCERHLLAASRVPASPRPTRVAQVLALPVAEMSEQCECCCCCCCCCELVVNRGRSLRSSLAYPRFLVT